MVALHKNKNNKIFEKRVKYLSDCLSIFLRFTFIMLLPPVFSCAKSVKYCKIHSRKTFMSGKLRYYDEILIKGTNVVVSPFRIDNKASHKSNLILIRFISMSYHTALDENRETVNHKGVSMTFSFPSFFTADHRTRIYYWCHMKRLSFSFFIGFVKSFSGSFFRYQTRVRERVCKK